MIPAFHAVAGDPAGAVWERSQQLRHDGMVDLVATLTKKSPLRKSVTKDHAANVRYLLLGPDLYWTMVLGLGWTERQLATWTERVVLNDLFDREADHNACHRASVSRSLLDGLRP